jgi:hypothetical protein
MVGKKMALLERIVVISYKSNESLIKMKIAASEKFSPHFEKCC